MQAMRKPSRFSFSFYKLAYFIKATAGCKKSYRKVLIKLRFYDKIFM